MRRRSARTVGSAAALAVAAAVLPTQSTTADVIFSQFDPPPLCSVHPGTGCVAQPNYTKYTSSLASPILIDMPTMRVDINETVTGGVPALEDVTGIVTFTITDGGATPPPYTFREAEWPAVMSLLPIPDKSDPTADGFAIYQRQWVIDGSLYDCEGKITCTYVTDDSPSPGWYIAGGANGYLVQKGGCLVNQFTDCFGDGTGKGSTGSLSAVYIPQVDDLDPPYVEVATTGSGLIAKAIAQAVDPGHQAMSLRWDFGDGTTTLGSFGGVASHTYAAPGAYVITATATAADGRMSSASVSAKVQPPMPILQAVARVDSGTTGVAAGALQGWPANPRASVRYWTDGCPVNPDVDYQYAPGFAEARATDEGTVSMDFNYLDPAANAFVLVATARVPAGPYDTVEVHGVSECAEMSPGTTYQTTAATAADATEVPVDSASVPVGNVAVVDAGADDAKQDLAEQRVVTGHGSLLVAALDRPHPSGAYVIDAGAPLEPYVMPGPPPDPTLLPVPEPGDAAGAAAAVLAILALKRLRGSGGTATSSR